MAIQLRFRLESGAWQTGGVTVDANHVGDDCQLGVVDGAGITQWYWEITDFPPDFSVPVGWLEATSGTYYSTSASPTSFILTHWGKFAFRLTVNGGLKQEVDGRWVNDPDKIDERGGVSVESPQGLWDVAATEQGQWDQIRAWMGAIKHDLRIIEAVLGTGGTGLRTRIIADAVADSNVTLSGTTTQDGVVLVDGDICFPVNQSNGDRKSVV
jgi:hypothetical protein